MPPSANQYKICPRCKTPTELPTPQCLTCGRVYNTQFTQVVAPSSVPAVSSTPVSTYGPKDRLEWNVSAFWHWLGLYFCLTYVVFGTYDCVRHSSNPVVIVFILSAIFGSSFCMVRLRRLYLYFTTERRPWWISAAVITALILLPLASLEYQYQTMLIHERRLQIEESDSRQRELQFQEEAVAAQRQAQIERNAATQRDEATAAQSQPSYSGFGRTYSPHPANTPSYSNPSPAQPKAPAQTYVPNQSGSEAGPTDQDARLRQERARMSGSENGQGLMGGPRPAPGQFGGSAQ